MCTSVYEDMHVCECMYIMSVCVRVCVYKRV